MIKKVGKPEAVDTDATNKTPALLYKRPRTKERFFRNHGYVEYERLGCYLCPSALNNK
ncbi:hypothetical protein [Peribacillus sp. NPDC096448]|uniref:hypothetical protein n=1 Tax=Peribacillus sp. NPDC096448 TaxID=3364395 RepID=UPI003810BFD1